MIQIVEGTKEKLNRSTGTYVDHRGYTRKLGPDGRKPYDYHEFVDNQGIVRRVPKIGGGTAAVPRERRIGSIPYVANNFGVDLQGPNGGLPMLNYEYFVLRLSGTLTADALADGTIIAENPRTLIKAVQIVITGLTGDTFIDLPLTELVVLTHYIGRRPATAPQEDAVTLSEVQIGGAITFYGEYYLPFALEDMSNPYRGFLNCQKYANVRLRVQWGSEIDFITLTAGSVALSATQVDVWGREYSYDPRFDLASEGLLHQRVTTSRTPFNSVAANDQDIEIPRTASYLRGILWKQFTQAGGAGEVPVSTLLTAETPITLLYNDTDRKFEYTVNQLTRQNRENYCRGAATTLPTGYLFTDLSPRGDFSLLQNMLNLQKIVQRTNTQSVANAILRTTLLKYAAA